MGKKKDVNGFKYRRQGSIDDENFLMLGHGIGTIKEAVEDAKIDLTETNKQLAEIKNAVDNMEVSVELGDINVDLEETNSKLNDINISLQDYLTNLKKKLDDFDNSIEILNYDVEDINYNITQLDLYAKTLDSYITNITEKLQRLETEISELNSDLSADTLLWQVTESEWTSGAQTIDLDLSGWRYVRVVWSQNSSTSTTGRNAIIAVRNRVDVQFPLNFGSSSTATPIVVNKVIRVSSTAVTGEQSVHVSFGTSGTTVNRESPYMGITAVWGVI